MLKGGYLTSDPWMPISQTWKALFGDWELEIRQ